MKWWNRSKKEKKNKQESVGEIMHKYIDVRTKKETN